MKSYYDLEQMYPVVEYHNLTQRFLLTNIPYFMIEGVIMYGGYNLHKYDLGKIYLN